ncbi:alpha/beta hydrolase family esterase [Actinoplanes sp. NPDC051494]|uniref:alpha/beta hydrolase family esterase n=1 Tax=Actinoplanes sp. NPDC051494 TaxID=3363907 RepID=UPI0037B5C579
MNRHVLLLGTAVLLLAGCTGRAPVRPPAPPAGTTTATLTVDGTERTYRIYRPVTVPAENAPLVIMLHGPAGTGGQAQQSYGWDHEADRSGFVVAYPDGIGGTWNAGPACCGVAARDDVDDIGFITALAKAVPGTDPSNTFATGISDGAVLAYRLACETSIFRAIAPVAGTMVDKCASPRPTSIIHIHGIKDAVIPYGGGPGRSPSTIDGPAIPDLMRMWRVTDRCDAPTRTVRGKVTTAVAPCPDARTVELVTIAGAGHQWPGSSRAPAGERRLDLDPPSTSLNATAVIWDFFLAHSRS